MIYDKKGRRSMRKKYLALALVLALSCSFTGCAKQTKQQGEEKYGAGVDSTFETDDMQLDTCVMAVGEEEVTLNEMLFYVYQLKSNYDGMMSSNVWDYSYAEDETVGGYIKDRLVKEIAQIKIICQEAKKQSVTLTEQEANEAKVEASEFVSALPKSAKEYHLTEALVSDIYQEHALAKKMYDVIGGTVNSEVSDEAAEETSEKQDIIDQREREAFVNIFSNWKNEYKIVASEELLDELNLG